VSDAPRSPGTVPPRTAIHEDQAGRRLTNAFDDPNGGGGGERRLGLTACDGHCGTISSTTSALGPTGPRPEGTPKSRVIRRNAEASVRLKRRNVLGGLIHEYENALEAGNLSTGTPKAKAKKFRCSGSTGQSRNRGAAQLHR
jgi:hypothetical protein